MTKDEIEKIEAFVGEKVIYGDVKGIVEYFSSRETAMLDEIEKPLNDSKKKAFEISNNEHSLQLRTIEVCLCYENVINNVLSIIQRRKGGK